MRVIDPKETATKDLHQYLLGSVAPRPIAFASTIDEEGRHNIAPYSFFNAFSSNPPILVFSSNRRVADNTTKDTLHNIMLNKEVVINVVNYDIVRQMALSSVSYPSDVSEFEKSGLSPIPALKVAPMRIKESPVHMECTVRDIITLGESGGAGHLIICDVVLMHVSEAVLDGDRIDPHKIDLVGRMGRAFYVRASGPAIHTIVQSVVQIPIGYDALPTGIRNSTILSANNIAQIAGLLEWPEQAAIDEIKLQSDIQLIIKESNPQSLLHQRAKEILDSGGMSKDAACLLLLSESLI